MSAIESIGQTEDIATVATARRRFKPFFAGRQKAKAALNQSLGAFL